MFYFRSILLTWSVVALAVRAFAAEAPAQSVASRPAGDAELSARSLVHTGDTARLERVLAKARRGEPLTVGVIGGSITQGASASLAERRYGNLVADWWQRRFPASRVNFVNAGIGATGSNYGALRAGRDLLAHKPDFVVAEYAVNDSNTRESGESLEGLVRQILRSPGEPALVLLFTMKNNGTNAQEWHEKVGRHYGLPMISFRDALWPEIQAGRLKWEDVEADIVHPNDRGHALAARFVTDFIERIMSHRSAASRPASRSAGLPEPLISDMFERVTLTEADAMTPVSNQGWTYDPQDRCWKADRPGSTVEFQVEGTAVFSMHFVLRAAMGRARVTVDGGASRDLEAWFDGTWGGYRQPNEVVRGLPAGRHIVRFELLADHHPQSTGSEFRILGLGTAR